MNKTDLKHPVENLLADLSLSHVTNPAIQKRAIENLKKADERLGRGVAVGQKLEKQRATGRARMLLILVAVLSPQQSQLGAFEPGV